MSKHVLAVQVVGVLIAFLSIFGALGAGPAGPDAGADDAMEGDELASMSLISQRTAFIQRVQDYIGVTFTIHPGWHLYWRNPGDSGGPIEVSIEAPEGVEVGLGGETVLWPTPGRLVNGSDVNYVYENRVTLIIPIRVTERVPVGQSVRIRAKANWVVCKSACKFGEGEAEIELPVVSTREEASNAPQFSLMSQSRIRLPGPVPQGGKMLDVRWEGDALVLECEEATEMRFFPYVPAEPQPRDAASAGATKGTKLTISYPPEIRAAERVRGVLNMTRAGVQWHLNIDVAPPKGE